MSIGNIEDIEWEATTDFTATQAVIYDDTPRPKWWRHPVKWWRWEQKITYWFDLGEPLSRDKLISAILEMMLKDWADYVEEFGPMSFNQCYDDVQAVIDGEYQTEDDEQA